MPNYQAVSPSAYAQQRWQRYTNYAFAAQDTVAALTVQEVAKAALRLPLAFLSEGEVFTLVAVQGVVPGRNLLVAADGRWRTPYIPAVYRSYPFRLGTMSDGQMVLCVDADSGLLMPDSQLGAQTAEAFFVDEQPSSAVREILEFLQAVAADRLRTAQLCAQLQALELLEPWTITLKMEQGEQLVEGLFRVSEERLNALSAAVLKELQQSGALVLALCQLLSMQNLALLSELARQQMVAASAAPAQGLPVNAQGALDLEFLHQGGTLNFGSL